MSWAPRAILLTGFGVVDKRDQPWILLAKNVGQSHAPFAETSTSAVRWRQPRQARESSREPGSLVASRPTRPESLVSNTRGSLLSLSVQIAMTRASPMLRGVSGK
jgi:hypothetical protein